MMTASAPLWAVFVVVLALAGDLSPWQALAASNVGLCVFFVLAGQLRGWPRLQFRFGQVVLIGALEVTQTAAYLYALQVGMVGPSAAAHLSVPVMFVLWQLSRRQRRFGVWEATSLTLLGGGVLLAGLLAGAGDGDQGGGQPLLGVALGLASAVGLAVVVRLLSLWGQQADLRTLVAPKAAVIAVIALPPAAMSGTPDGGSLAAAFALGLGVASAATLLQWGGIPGLPNSVAGAIMLSEAVWSAVVGALLFGRPLGWLAAATTVMILAGVLIELAADRRRQPAGASVPPGVP